jgi:putative hydrolase of the HAD superfamily
MRRIPTRDPASDLHEHPSGVQAVLLDFYGTLARATTWVSLGDVLDEHGYELAPELQARWWNEGFDGVEHPEYSTSRERYQAWTQQRLLGMLAETDVHPGEYELIVKKLREGSQARVLEAYPEVPDALTALRAGGVRLAICSNWDWDLAEAVDEVGLTDAFDTVVSSAWAGARKPHPRIFEHTLDKVGVEPHDALFVGDTWVPDVEGPRAVGMQPVYLERDGHWPDATAPEQPDADERAGVIVKPDLSDLADLLTAQQ